MLKPGIHLSAPTSEQRRALSRWDNEGGAKPGDLALAGSEIGVQLDYKIAGEAAPQSSKMAREHAMLESRNVLRARLASITTRIDEIRHRMELKGIFSRDHEATMAELQERQKILDEQLSDEFADIEAHGHHVSTLEQIVLNWGNKLNF